MSRGSYRDFPYRVCDGVGDNVPECQVVIGPFTHKYAFESNLQPKYDDRAEMARFFGKWLRGDKDTNYPPKRVVYLRESMRPGNIEHIPGRWIASPNTTNPLKFFAGSYGQLTTDYTEVKPFDPIRIDYDCEIDLIFRHGFPPIAPLDFSDLAEFGPVD